MTEAEALHLINTTPALQSILYDCGMLPEQQMTGGSKQWLRVMAYALIYQAGMNDGRNACIKVCDEMANAISGGEIWTALGAVEECADTIRESSNTGYFTRYS
jgi:hypothetical protein